MGLDVLSVSEFVFATVGTPVVIGVDPGVFTEFTERAAREDDPKRRRRVNRLALLFQYSARSTATKSDKIERMNNLRLLVASVLLDVGVLLCSWCWRASEDIYRNRFDCTDRSDAQILALTRNLWKRRQAR